MRAEIVLSFSFMVSEFLFLYGKGNQAQLVDSRILKPS